MIQSWSDSQAPASRSVTLQQFLIIAPHSSICFLIALVLFWTSKKSPYPVLLAC